MMDNKKNKRISRALILLIIILLAAAIGFSIGEDNPDARDALNDDVQNQISLELRSKKPQVSDTIEVSGMKEGDTMVVPYIVRVNHTAAMDLFFRIDVEKATDGIDQDLNIKVYDITSNKVIFDDNFKDLNNQVYKEEKTANASKKNDTRYEVTIYFDGPVGDRYQNSELTATLNWYVSDDAADDLIMSRSGDVKIILYAFIAVVVLIVVIMVVFRDRLKESAFKPLDFEDNDEEDKYIE